MSVLQRSIALTVIAACSVLFSGCGGGGGGGTTPPAPAPTGSAGGSNPPPVPQSSADCPTSGSTVSSIAFTAGSTRAPMRNAIGERYVPGMIVATDAQGAIHVRSVDPAKVDRAIADWRSSPGIRSVQRAQYRRLFSVTPDDPYFRGFGPGAPYFESSTSPGQWDMHVIGLPTAWSSVEKGAPIAIIDTGVDVTHPELQGGKIVYTHCYVTYPSNASQSSGPYVTDLNGHGTNVAGIAAADTNNLLGFAGTAFNAPILAFRIFPSPPSAGCEGTKTSSQCDTTDVDEVAAINDAVNHGARVINLSLGADGPLSICQDSIEEKAIENAISHGVVVVAAAGNETANHLDCPAAYPGVIAVGASALEGSGNAVKEGVAGYSNWVGASGPGAGGAYLVAPGGDPSGDSDSDELHWIENIFSSTAGVSGACSTDAAGKAGDCRILIAGTSQATPHVAGVVSLMLGLRPSLSPAQIASDLCATAANIGSTKQGCGRLNAAAAVAKAATQ